MIQPHKLIHEDIILEKKKKKRPDNHQCMKAQHFKTTEET